MVGLPKAEISIELDDPEDCVEILKGDRFRHARVETKAGKGRLIVKVEADTAKMLVAALGSIIKQVRIIEDTSDIVTK